ncbi:MAG: protein translocase subunit SecD [Eubacterium sp.]|nr:protein translocase subunit SecD [Eubacterium sp.]
MKKTKRNAVIFLLLFCLVVAGAVYMALYGVGKNSTGRAKDISLGLDLQGGVSITYQIMDDDATSDQIDTTIEKLQRRVENYSTEGEVYKEGQDRITVEIPLDTAKYDPNKVLEELGKPGDLMFMDQDNYTKFTAGEEYTPALTGADVENADAGIDKANGTGANEYIVHLQFNEAGTQKFADATTANVGKPLYIIYDGEVVSAPNVREAITGGSAQIDGQESLEEARTLASTIKIGALPLTLSELRSQVVGAKLGNDAIRTALLAGAIGICIIFLIMLVVYRFPGFVSCLALACYVILELLGINICKITLTLPGIAGILLSIGMAVDANVIIFTRIKEEIGNGLSVKSAIDAGFKKAFSAIFDGNITTIIAGLVLLWMGSGQVKGFARTLILGIILSMFTALVITRFLLKMFAELGITNEKLYGKAKPAKVRDFAKYFKLTGSISLIAVLLGIAFLFVNKGIDGRNNTMNYSLEFSGGTSTTVTFDHAMSLVEAETEVVPVIEQATGINPGTTQIQVVDANNQVVFKTAELSQDKREALDNALIEKFGLDKADIESENISSTISSEMRRDAILAVAIAAVLMLIYIAFRFNDVRFGASAVIALIHDVMVVFMVYSVAWLSVGSTFIACMLTLVGYSINSTIIIFDRIRENMQTVQYTKDAAGYTKIVNTSISQTITRNIYTNLTSFATILMLFILGVSSLKEFTLTLMIGIICGAYSSIFITGPLWLTLRKYIGKKQQSA